MVWWLVLGVEVVEGSREQCSCWLLVAVRLVAAVPGSGSLLSAVAWAPPSSCHSAGLLDLQARIAYGPPRRSART
eukprot:10846497-Prorocentrum_lima.AAC.1